MPVGRSQEEMGSRGPEGGDFWTGGWVHPRLLRKVCVCGVGMGTRGLTEEENGLIAAPRVLVTTHLEVIYLLALFCHYSVTNA